MIIGILGFGSIGKRHAKNLIGLKKKKVLIFDTNKKKKKMKLKGWAANSYLIRKIL